ncbi:MAG: DUF1524 domain-containing protein [Chloroflexi bacterium]|nr:DUF1524 domain-containing protein [Chloroflexota bacterium]
MQSLQPFLMEIDLKTTNAVPKLRLNVDDNEFFTRTILPVPGDPQRNLAPTRESHRRIQKAAELASQHVADIIKPYTAEAQRVARLVEWVEFVKGDALVILLRVPSHLNAFVMFETLNDRGLRASQADLIKNYLLSQAGNRKAEAQAKWAATVATLESIGQGELTVTYLHHFLIGKFGPMRASEVYEKVRLLVDTSARALEFTDEISSAAQDYAALWSDAHAKWNTYGSTTRNYVATINRDLRVEQIRPLMLAVARHFDMKEAQRAFRLFVFWSVRFLIAGGRGGLLDRNYSVTAQEVTNGKITTAKGLTDALQQIIPNDTIFEALFAEARVSQTQLARYYLRALERTAKGQTEPELIPNDDEQVVNLEHVLPNNPQSFWPDIDPETASAYWRRIGNLVLLQATVNSNIGNKPFDEKKKAFAKSGFSLTSEVAAQAKWGVSEIEERQQRLAKLAVKTWPVK